ncbi:MAG: hypothetical protein WD512_11210 [Candidatus Paceibacterota bacterium]
MWWYQDKEFTDDQIGENIGFVYIIKNLKTGKLYIGKKVFTFKKVKRPKKGKKNRQHSRIPSNWSNYYGSNKILLEDVESLGKEKFKRTILHLCRTKGIASYLEATEIIQNNALIDDNFYNEYLLMRVSKSHLRQLIT